MQLVQGIVSTVLVNRFCPQNSWGGVDSLAPSNKGPSSTFRTDEIAFIEEIKVPKEQRKWVSEKQRRNLRALWSPESRQVGKYIQNMIISKDL